MCMRLRLKSIAVSSVFRCLKHSVRSIFISVIDCIMSACDCVYACLYLLKCGCMSVIQNSKDAVQRKEATTRTHTCAHNVLENCAATKLENRKAFCIEADDIATVYRLHMRSIRWKKPAFVCQTHTHIDIARCQSTTAQHGTLSLYQEGRLGLTEYMTIYNYTYMS